MMHSRRLVLGSLLLTVALPMAACSSGSSGSSNSTTKTDTIVYGLPTAAFDVTTVGIQFGISQGYFDKQHIKVEVKLLNGSTAPIRALLSGDIDVGDTAPDTAAIAVQSGAPLQVISYSAPHQAGMTLGAPNVKTLKDLEGKTYAISAPGAASDTQITAELKAAGVDVSKVNKVALGGPDARIKALLAGKVDGAGATILAIPTALDAVSQGKLNVLSKDADFFPHTPQGVEAVTSSYLAKNKDLLTRFLTAELQGYQWAVSHCDQAAQTMSKFIKDTPVDTLKEACQQMVDLGGFGDKPITADDLTGTLTAMAQAGTIKSGLKATDFGDASLSQAAGTAAKGQ
jgi:NitT/TauT family transport system substrate-binding protein